MLKKVCVIPHPRQLSYSILHSLSKNFDMKVKFLLWWFGGLVAKSCPILAILWTVACQAPLSMGFSRQEYWSILQFPSPGDLPNPGIESGSPALQAEDLPTELFCPL